ncbi:hypothetical protein KC318_g5144 [Hortaea werneckii]|nr:hypothetical protein KC334_g6236 [Hortaea werneckii]KAI7005725.1 hypothetical protein KC355_g8084 [Hortaea werneckii]KAI7668667.1 hypothetical protein KC318_g5144 [Hortaea werneckii]
MDESTLLSRTGKKLRKSLKPFRIHLKRVKTRTQAKSQIHNRSSTFDDLANLQSIFKSHNLRTRKLNKSGLDLRERSLQRMLAGQLRRRPTIGVEPFTWWMKRAMSEVKQELRREAVALQGIEGALLTALQCLLRSYHFLRGMERDDEYQLWAPVVAMAENLQREIETRRVDEGLRQELRDKLAAAVGPRLAEARAWMTTVKGAVLKLACQASQQGVKVARQTLLEEYF